MALAVVCSVSASLGADFPIDEITVVSMPFGDDLYIAGGKVVVTEPVTGDLLAAGGSLIINGPVDGDLQAAGGSLILNGAVGDDLRVAGGDITLVSNVGGDIVVYGGSVTIPPGVEVKGNAIIGSGALYLGGTIMGDLRVDAGRVDFSGIVHGDARFYGDEQIKLNGRIDGETVVTARNVTLGSAAGFGKDVVYWRKRGELDFGQTSVGGQVRFAPELKRDEPGGARLSKERVVRKGLGAAFSLFFFGTFLSGILAVAIGVLLFKRTFREAGEVLHITFWKGLGVGILTYLLLPVTALIAMFTLVGIPIGLLLLTLFAFSVIFGRVITAIAFAAWIERRRAGQWSAGRLMLAAMGLFAVIKLAGLVPFLGWVLVLLATLAGYGALVAALLDSRREMF
jgi:hypothetical protein